MQIRYKIPLLFTAVILITAMVPKPPVRIFMVGDSTMANKVPERYPETGWGQVFNQQFSNNVTIYNRAVNGRSTKSFITENRWQHVLDSLQAGDYVFIEFGHNDEKVDIPCLGTSLDEFKANLIRYVTETRAKKAIPVLLTPVERRMYKNDTLYNTHGGYPDVTKQVAAEYKVPMIDMQKKSHAYITAAGIKPSLKLFLQVDSGVSKNYPTGIRDNTHFSEQGAKAMAGLAADGIKELKLSLADYLQR